MASRLRKLSISAFPVMTVRTRNRIATIDKKVTIKFFMVKTEIVLIYIFFYKYGDQPCPVYMIIQIIGI